MINNTIFCKYLWPAKGFYHTSNKRIVYYLSRIIIIIIIILNTLPKVAAEIASPLTRFVFVNYIGKLLVE